MRVRTPAITTAAVAALAVWATSAAAQNDDYQVPPNALTLDDTGTLDEIRGNYVKFRDSKENVWVLAVQPGQTAISIEGTADASFLRPGLVVELTGTVNDKLAIEEPIEDIEVISSKGRLSSGLFSPDEDDENAKPLKKPEVGKYRIRGRLATVGKEGQLMVVAGRFKITGTLGDEPKVKLTFDGNDTSRTRFGDTLKVNAWYVDAWKPNPALMRFGKAVAKEVKITLSDPTAGKGR
jgi:hypothetical protein